MFPRSQPVVNWMIRRRPSSPKTRGQMIGCWMLAVIGSVLSEERSKSKLMGFIHCTWIPFILVTINQSHCSPLLILHSANPLVDLKTHNSTSIVELFLCHDSHNPLCLWIHVLCLAFSLSLSHLIAPSLHDHDKSAYCQPHSGSVACGLHTPYCSLFLANWSMCCPALNFLVYN